MRSKQMLSKRLARTASALVCSLALATGAVAQTGTAAAPAADGAPTPAADQGEPLPPGAPTDPYELTGWCYGALAEYLQIYDQVKPELIAIDKLFGSPVKEAEPYQSDVKVYHDELKIFGEAIVAAEKASPRVISGRGAAAIRSGQGIWQQAEARNRRELAHAWLSWGMPDACDTSARKLLASATVLGKALKFNQGHAENAASPAPDAGSNGATANADNVDGGALVLAPIAPVVTHDAAAPVAPPPQPAMAGAQRVPDEGAVQASPSPTAPTTTAGADATPPPAVATAEPPAAAPPAPEPAAPAPGAVVASAQPSRIVEDTPAATVAAAPAAEMPSPPAPVAAAEPQAAPSPTPQRAAASAAPTPAPTADEPQEPVL